MGLTDYKNSTRTKDFFNTDWVKNLGITNEMVPTVKKRGWERKLILCNNVFNTFFQILIDDIIDNDVVFYAPVRPQFTVYMKVMGNAQMNRIYNNPGIYGDVNLIKTNGRVYCIGFTLPYVKMRRHQEIRISYKDYKRIVKRANDEYIYCGVKKVKLTRYIDLMTKEFPTLNEKIIRKIITKGCNGILNAIVYGKPVLLQNPQIKLYAYIYKPIWRTVKMKANT
jgi:hypothetical protein